MLISWTRLDCKKQPIIKTKLVLEYIYSRLVASIGLNNSQIRHLRTLKITDKISLSSTRPSTLASLHGLLSQQWLQDDIVDSYTFNAELRINRATGGRKKVLIAPSDFQEALQVNSDVPGLAEYAETTFERLRQQLLEEDPEYLAFVCLKRRIHWAPCIIALDSKIVYEGDSAGWDPIPDLLTRIKSALGGSNVKSAVWSLKHINVVQQGNSWDCGVVAVNAIETFLDPAARAWTPSLSYQFRHDLFAQLVRTHLLSAEVIILMFKYIACAVTDFNKSQNRLNMTGDIRHPPQVSHTSNSSPSLSPKLQTPVKNRSEESESHSTGATYSGFIGRIGSHRTLTGFDDGRFESPGFDDPANVGLRIVSHHLGETNSDLNTLNGKSTSVINLDSDDDTPTRKLSSGAIRSHDTDDNSNGNDDDDDDDNSDDGELNLVNSEDDDLITDEEDEVEEEDEIQTANRKHMEGWDEISCQRWETLEEAQNAVEHWQRNAGFMVQLGSFDREGGKHSKVWLVMEHGADRLMAYNF